MLFHQYTKVLLALRFYASGNFFQVIGDTVRVNKAAVLQTVYSSGEPFENKSFAQFYDVK